LGAALFAVVLMVPRFWEPNRSEVIAVTAESRHAAQPAPQSSDTAPARAPVAESLPAPPAAAKQNRRQEPALQRGDAPSPANGAARSRADASSNELNAVAQSSGSAGLVAPAAPPNYTPAPVPLAAVQARASRLGADAQASLPAAVTAGDATRLTQLLDQGVSAQQADSVGRSPLLLAVIANRADMVQLLLARGADPNAADPAGETPLKRARRDNLPRIAAMLEAAGAH
jgi:ankyrin repeat protein